MGLGILNQITQIIIDQKVRVFVFTVNKHDDAATQDASGATTG